MLSVESFVNEYPISFLCVHNEIKIDEEGNYIYHVEYERTDEPIDLKFEINHKREEGMEKLLLLIYQEIDKRLKRESNPKIL
ncbi:MAG: hypothetical protein AABX99_04380 [Nanoarchaeota archaeon]